MRWGRVFRPQPPSGNRSYRCKYELSDVAISIHSPLAEADIVNTVITCWSNYFNPQPPRGSWLQICLIFFFIQDIFYTNHTTLLIILQPMISKLFSFLKFFLKTKCESPMLFMCTWHSHQYSNLHYQVFIYQNYGSKSCSPYSSSPIRSLLRLSTKNFYSIR